MIVLDMIILAAVVAVAASLLRRRMSLRGRRCESWGAG